MFVTYTNASRHFPEYISGGLLYNVKSLAGYEEHCKQDKLKVIKNQVTSKNERHICKYVEWCSLFINN